MTFNYKIIRHINDEEQETLLELSNTDLLFVNIAPIEHSSQIFISNNKIATIEELSQYNGNFSFVLRNNAFITDEIIDLFNQIFNILYSCEQNESIISIIFSIYYDETTIEENPELISNSSTILNKASIGLTTKTFRIEDNNSIINMISVAYKNSD